MRSVRPGVYIEHPRAGLEAPGVDAEIGQLADVGVGHDLEGQGGERLIVGGVAHRLVLIAVPGPLGRLDAP